MSKIRHSLTLRLTAVIAATLLVFVLLAGLVYNLLMQEATVEHYSHVLQRNAYAISQNLHDLVAGGDSLDETRLDVSWDTLAPYLALCEQITRSNVYLVDAHHVITGYFEGIVQSLDGVLLPAYLEQSIAQGFMGKTPFLRSGIGKDTRLTTCAPIMDEDSRVLGVVLLDVSLQELGYTQVSGTTMLVVSLAVAFIIALLLAFILSLLVCRPIRSTREAALTLASGEYETRLPVRGKDEVGELASSINVLAQRLEEAKQRDLQLQRRQQEFFSNVSHELRTPVTVIRGSVESLEDGLLVTPEQQRTAYDQIRKETEWLHRLIDELLELSRLQDPEFVIEKEDVDLSSLLSDVAMSAGALCTRKGVVFDCAEPERSYTVRGDYQRLRQMLMAVLDNAVKFTPAGKRVSLSLSTGAPLITVKDEGPGIPADELEGIFNRFYHTRAGNSGGTGLGLALVKEIARRHGLEIAVKSRVDEGTEMSFRFQEYK